MTITENVALEPAEGVVESRAARDEQIIFGRPASSKADSAPWMFDGDRVITDVLIAATEDAFETAEPIVQTRWAVCLDGDPGEPEGWIVAQVIAMPGIASQGCNKAEALENIREALSLALDQLTADGVTKIPLPPYEIPAGGQVVYVTV